jgi:hypothetical protein
LASLSSLGRHTWSLDWRFEHLNILPLIFDYYWGQVCLFTTAIYKI